VILRAVRLSKKAEKELHELFRGNKEIYSKIKSELLNLSENPFKGKPLVGDKKGCFRLRVGDYRIIYEISGNEIWVIKIGHRRDVYR